jgi:hypothetical protein
MYSEYTRTIILMHIGFVSILSLIIKDRDLLTSNFAEMDLKCLSFR